MIKRYCILIGMIVLLLFGCSKKIYEQYRSTSGQAGSVTHVSSTQIGEIRTEKDTARMIDAPVEESRNRGTDSSYLTTSLAWSSAVCRDGQLDHRIGNLPKVKAPVREIYIDRWHTLHDTLIIRDTLWRENTATVTKEITPPGLRIWAGIGKGLLILLVVAVLWYKFMRKWR